MGCDIHYLIQKLDDDKWVTISNSRNPNANAKHFNDQLWNPEFAFLAGVKNYWNVEPLCELKGLPSDIKPFIDSDNRISDPIVSGSLYEDDFWMGDHHHTWYEVDELLEVGPPILYTRYYVSLKTKTSGKTNLKSSEYRLSRDDTFSEPLHLSYEKEQVSDVLFTYLEHLQNTVRKPLRIVIGFDN